jgi:hypothetical protein
MRRGKAGQTSSVSFAGVLGVQKNYTRVADSGDVVIKNKDKASPSSTHMNQRLPCLDFALYDGIVIFIKYF